MIVPSRFSWMVLLFAAVFIVSVSNSNLTHGIHCVPNERGTNFCANFPLNYSAIPNFRGGFVHSEIESELNTFFQLYASGCSNALVHFLCSYYNPPCFRVPVGNGDAFFSLRLQPCRELCHYVRSSCEPFLNSQGFQWPVHFGCSQFASSSETKLCFPRYGTLQEYQELDLLSVPAIPYKPLSILKGTEIRMKKPTVSLAGSYSVKEGKSVNLVLEVDHQADCAFTASLDSIRADPTDYAPGPYTVTFSPGQTTANLSIPTTDDDIAEHDEVFQVEITSVNSSCGVQIGSSNLAYVTIQDNDVVKVFFDPNSTTVVEGDRAKLTMFTDREFSFNFTVGVMTMNITATAPSDYLGGVFPVTFTAGSRMAMVFINTTSDETAEMSEEFKVVIQVPDDEDLVMTGDPDTAVVTITDDDVVEVFFDPNSTTVVEGDRAKLTLFTNRDFSFNFTLDVMTMDITATAPSDYLGGVFPVTFTAGSRMAMVFINTTSDETAEMSEEFKVVIQVPDDEDLVMTGDPDTAVVTITDDDVSIPPRCSKSYCKRNPSKTLCLVPDLTPGNTTRCTGAYEVTTCGACYYSTSVRDHPKRCTYTCPGRIDEECLQTYGQCVRNKMVKKFGKPTKALKKVSNFKCFSPVC